MHRISIFASLSVALLAAACTSDPSTDVSRTAHRPPPGPGVDEQIELDGGVPGATRPDALGMIEPVDAGFDAGRAPASDAGAVVDAAFDAGRAQADAGRAEVDAGRAQVDAGASIQEGTARVVINELNANVDGSCDLIELRVLEGGRMTGWRLEHRTSLLLTFGDFEVHANDLIVVHANGPDATCNPGSAAQETTAPSEAPRSVVSTNFDGAFDWYSPARGGVQKTDTVITLFDADGRIVDAVLAADDPSGTAAADSERRAAEVVVQGQWRMAGGGVPPGGFVDDAFSANAVLDLDATGLEPAGDSLQRRGDQDTDTALDWTMAPSTFGALNPGQSQR